MNYPCDSHWDAVDRILQYMKGKNHSLQIKAMSKSWDIQMLIGQDYLLINVGYCALEQGNLVSRKSVQQNVVA